MLARTLFAAFLLGAPAMAQDAQTQQKEPPKRVRSVVLLGNDECPKSQDPDEIVVCSREGDSPYRIPKRFRDQPKEDAVSQAWSNRAANAQEAASVGLPGTCSPVGSAAQTGCSLKEIQAWARERAAQKRKESQVP